MITKRKAGLVLIVIFTMIVNFTVNAFDQDMTRHIESTDQDRYVLETGQGVDATFMTALSPYMDIRGMLFFENIKINNWEKLTNATLRLRTLFGQPFDAASTITIYGVRDYAQFGYSSKQSGAPQSPSAILNLPITSAHVDYNTSQFYGPYWWEIDVTNIVNEMKNDPHYDGPGSDASKRGDNMIFTIYGAAGHDERFFYDFKSGNGLEAQLVLHWTDSPHPPPSLPPSAEYVNTSGGWDIWRVMEWLNFTEYTVWGAASGKVTNLNDTYFDLDTYQGGSALRVYKNWDDDGSGIVGRKWGIHYTAVSTAPPPASGRLGLVGWTDDFEYVSAAGSEWVNGSIFYLFIENAAPDESRMGVYSIRNDVLIDQEWVGDLFLPYVPYTHYYDYYLNMNTGAFTVDTYNDLAMTDLNTTYTDVLAPIATYFQGGYQYEYLIAGWHGGIPGPDPTTMSGAFLSSDQADFYIVDPTTNETIPVPDVDGDGDIDEDDARTLIGDVDPQPGDPAPGQAWEGTEGTVFSRFRIRLYILLIGVGLVFGPLFVFASSRPSGYEFTIGMFVMLIGFSLMYAAGQV